MRLIAQIVGQLNLHRPFHQPPGQLREQAPGPSDPRSLLAPANSSSITSALIRSRSGRSIIARSFARSTASSISCSLTWDRCCLGLRKGAGGSPGGSPPPYGLETLARTSFLSLVEGMTNAFAHAHTNPRTLPIAGTGAKPCKHLDESKRQSRRPPSWLPDLRNGGSRAPSAARLLSLSESLRSGR
jgi:hypothetical protein